MRKVKLSNNGPEISAMGLGCMGMSEFYGESDDKESIRTIHHAFSKGVNFLDTADAYGMGHNETLVGKAIREWSGKREDVVIATKFGIQRTEGKYERTINGRPEYVREACENSLRRLGVDTIDLYYQHRVDSGVPIEETVGAMKELVEQGKVRYLGLSEASLSTIRKANEVHPIAAVQTEYSLWTRDIEKEILPGIREAGILLVAYSPLGRGFLTGAIHNTESLSDNDFRRLSPRFSEGNFEKNEELVKKLEQLAGSKGATAGQIALAWLYSRGDDIVTIPGTRKSHRLDENVAALDVELSQEERTQLDEWFDPIHISGERYPEAGMKGINI